MRKLYEHCPLGPPRALVPPPREPRPAAATSSPKKSLLRSAVSVVKAAVQLSPRKPRAGPAAPEHASRRPDHATRRPGSARRRAAAAALADNEGAPPPKRPPRPHYRGTAKTDAAIAFRRDRAAKPAAPTPADRFRTVDESASWSFDYLSLFSDGDGRSASSSSHSRGAERVQRPASAGARQPPPRPKLATQQLGLEVVRPALADDRAASMRW